jgi:hypothetical protein
MATWPDAEVTLVLEVTFKCLTQAPIKGDGHDKAPSL